MAIDINEEERQVSEQPFHQLLECLGQIFQPKGHKGILKKPEWCDNCLFEDILPPLWELVDSYMGLSW
jgi:hypothetical protein